MRQRHKLRCFFDETKKLRCFFDETKNIHIKCEIKTNKKGEINLRTFNMEGLKDLWEDYSSAIKSTKIDFKKAKIYQAKEIKTGGLEMLVTSVSTGKQETIFEQLPDKMCYIINKSECFYEIDGIRYIPSREVNSRTLNDYSRKNIVDDCMNKGKTKEPPITVNHFSSPDTLKTLAGRLRRTDELIGIHYKPVRARKKVYARLVGLKSMNGENQISAVEIARCLYNKCGRSMLFESAYLEQIKRQPALSFTFRCKPARLRSDGIPVCILFQDTLSGRKSMRVDFAVKIDNRLYILDSMEVNHRTKMSGDEIADNIIKRFEVCYTADLNLNITANDIIKNVLQKGLVPKKAEERFVTYMSSINTDTPIAMASDVIKTGIFNIKNKKHTSSGYDGGKRRYELELGRALIR